MGGGEWLCVGSRGKKVCSFFQSLSTRGARRVHIRVGPRITRDNIRWLHTFIRWDENTGAHMTAHPPRPLHDPLKGVVFDLDDTLVQSTVDYERFKHLIISRIEEDGDDPAAYSPTENILSLLARYTGRMRGRGVPEERILESMREFERIMDDVELERVHETRDIDGAAELLRQLRARGVKVGVLTRGCERYAYKALELTGLRDLVDEVEPRRSDVPPKPSPESYLRLVGRMGLEVDETIMVGDHVIDAQCAENAGATFIGVRTGDLTEEELRDAGSLEVFASVREMAPWLERVIANGM